MRTAAELRNRDHQGKITIVGAENHPPYDRPPLSSSLLSAPDPVWLADDLGFDWPQVADEVHLGVHATGLHVGPTTTVTTDGAGEINARNVVIATGSTPINPWPSTSTLTTLDDAHVLREQLGQRPTRVVIIGAGWIGVELAHELTSHGHEVTLVESDADPLARHLGQAAAYVRPWMSHIDLRLSTTVTGVSTVDGEHVVHTSGGDIHGAVVITAIGVRPTTGWLGSSQIELDEQGFIPVGAGGKVSTPTGRVWAVGDVAVSSHPFFGTVRGGHWFQALRDPERVAASILDADLPPAMAPEVFSDQGSHHVETLGVLHGEETVLRGDVQEGSWVVFHLAGGRLVGAVVANSPRDTSSIRRALAQTPPPRLTAGELTNTAEPLRRLLRRRRGS